MALEMEHFLPATSEPSAPGSILVKLVPPSRNFPASKKSDFTWTGTLPSQSFRLISSQSFISLFSAPDLQRRHFKVVLHRGEGFAGFGVEGGLAGGELAAQGLEGGRDLGVGLGVIRK